MKKPIQRVLFTFVLSVVSTLLLVVGLEWLSHEVYASGTRYVAPDCTGMPKPCYMTVQDAVDAAISGDYIYVKTGLYTNVHARAGVTQVVYLSKTVTLRGGYTFVNGSTYNPISYPTTLDAQGLGRVFTIIGDISPTIEGLEITGGDATDLGGGDAGGGVYVREARLMFKNNVVSGNIARAGAGIYALQADVVVEGCHIVDNIARSSGGGIAIDNTKAAIRNNLVESNTTAGYGGGLAVALVDPEDGEDDLTPISVTIHANRISNNFARLEGGGLNIHDYTDWTSFNLAMHVSHNYIRDNATFLAGGGIGVNNNPYNASSIDVHVHHNILVDNETNGDGGGLGLYFAFGVFENNMILSNTAGYGGGLAAFHGGGTYNNNIIADNWVYTSGGGIHVRSGWHYFIHTTIARNQGGDGSGMTIKTAPGDIVPITQIMLTNTVVASQTLGITATLGYTGGTTRKEVTLDHVLWFANAEDISGTASVTVTHPYTGDPAFVNAGAGDYHIGVGSAAMDRGVDAGVVTDIDGDARPAGRGFDLGADEFPALLGVGKECVPNPVQAGARLTCVLYVTNTSSIKHPITVTDYLPHQIVKGETPQGTVIMPGGVLTWTPTITASGRVWAEHLVMTVTAGYAGLLTNTLQATVGNDTYMAVCEVNVIPNLIYLPLILRR